MCVIINLEPGQMIPLDMLTNAYHNNPHGYGVILWDKNNKKIQIVRKVDKYDVSEIKDILCDNADIHRFLHLRWKTEGPINMDNTHPFTSYHSDSDQIFFMHNGTLNGYKPRDYVAGVKVEESTTHSDSRRFNEEILQPLLLALKGNITDPIVRLTLEKYWDNGSRGLLVSSKQGPLLLAPSQWKDIEYEEDGNKLKFKASNDSYFKGVTRGPEYDRRKKVQEAKEAAEKAERARRFQGTSDANSPTKGTNGWPIVPMSSIAFYKKADLQTRLSRILEDHNLYTPEGIAALSLIRPDELDSMLKKDPDTFIQLFILATDEFTALFERYNRLKEFLESGKANEQEIKAQEQGTSEAEKAA